MTLSDKIALVTGAGQGRGGHAGRMVSAQKFHWSLDRADCSQQFTDSIFERNTSQQATRYQNETVYADWLGLTDDDIARLKKGEAI
jgi:NAD(P)-dependent dehydrogenase (short-subunit alcohol dehydrogenase family)